MGVRGKEAADFAAEEKELMETIDMLQRASSILEREMKGGASMMQLKSAGSVSQAFAVMVQASLIGSADATKLTAFVQSAQKNEDANDGESPGAPAAAVYESQGGGIVDLMQDLLEKAESQLAELRQKETASLNNFQLMKQSLLDEIRFANKELDEAKKGIASSAEKES